MSNPIVSFDEQAVKDELHCVSASSSRLVAYVRFGMADRGLPLLRFRTRKLEEFGRATVRSRVSHARCVSEMAQ